MITYVNLISLGIADGFVVHILCKMCNHYNGMFRSYFSQVQQTDESDISLVLHETRFSRDSNIEQLMTANGPSSCIPVIIRCSGNNNNNNLSHLQALYVALDQNLVIIIMREEYLLEGTTEIAGLLKEILKEGRSADLNQIFQTNYFGLPFSSHNRLMKFDAIVQKLKTLSHFLLTLGLLNCVNIGFGLIYCFLNCWRVQKREMKQLEIRQRILNERAKKTFLQLSSKERCMICSINPREILLQDCGHVIFCIDCFELLKNKNAKCLICRKLIHQIHHAFL